MERFIVFIIDLDINNFVSDLMQYRPDLSGVVLRAVMVFVNEDEANELIVDLLKKHKITTLLILDNREDICYIYVAERTIRSIKAGIMLEISKTYKEIMGEELFLSEFKDMRPFMKILINLFLNFFILLFSSKNYIFLP